MKLTIGRKLAGGFGVVLVLLAGVASVVHLQTGRVQNATSKVVDEAVPAFELCLKLQSEIHHALSMNRGYMVLGLPTFAKEHQDAWELIDGYTSEIDVLSAGWTDRAMLDDYSRFKEVMADFRVAQQKIADVSQTPGDHPARTKFSVEAEPFGDEMVSKLQAILDVEETSRVLGDRKLLVRRIAAAESHVLRSRAAVAAYLASGDPTDEAKIGASLRESQASVDRLLTMTDMLDARQQKHFRAYLSARESFLSATHEAVAMRSQSDHSVSEDICLNTAMPLSIEAINLMGAIASRQMEIKDAAVAENEKASSTMLAMTRGVAAVSLLVGGGIAFWLGRSISHRLCSVADYAERIAAKDLTVATLDIKGGDEIAQIARSMTAMNGALRQIIGDVSSATNEVAGAATQISASNEQMAAGMTEQTREIEQICGAVTEMSASVEEVAARAGNASANAQSSGQTAREGGKIVTRTIRGMHAIDEAVAGSAASVQELGRRGEQIGAIIQTINDIADQTNLLALNAAIEAARAGEHGRGFAVVADEIRKLAERTTEATEEVGESISAIQNETAHAVRRMEAGAATVQEGVALAGKAGESLERIVVGAESLTSAVVSIATSAEEQAVASNHVSEAIEKIRAVVQQSNVGTQQAAAAAHQLNVKSEELNRLVTQFKL